LIVAAGDCGDGATAGQKVSEPWACWYWRRKESLKGRMSGKIKGMTTQATVRRVKRSFTLTPEVAAFVTETRQKQRAKSDSEALVLLLRELMLEARREQLESATKAYYDTASEEELAEQREWAEQASRSLWIGVPE
jgi:hypothetical protein